MTWGCRVRLCTTECDFVLQSTTAIKRCDYDVCTYKESLASYYIWRLRSRPCPATDDFVQSASFHYLVLLLQNATFYCNFVLRNTTLYFRERLCTQNKRGFVLHSTTRHGVTVWESTTSHCEVQPCTTEYDFAQQSCATEYDFESMDLEGCKLTCTHTRAYIDIH